MPNVCFCTNPNKILYTASEYLTEFVVKTLWLGHSPCIVPVFVFIYDYAKPNPGLIHRITSIRYHSYGSTRNLYVLRWFWLFPSFSNNLQNCEYDINLLKVTFDSASFHHSPTTCKTVNSNITLSKLTVDSECFHRSPTICKIVNLILLFQRLSLILVVSISLQQSAKLKTIEEYTRAYQKNNSQVTIWRDYNPKEKNEVGNFKFSKNSTERCPQGSVKPGISPQAVNDSMSNLTSTLPTCVICNLTNWPHSYHRCHKQLALKY